MNTTLVPADVPVIPAQAGIQGSRIRGPGALDPRLRGDDGIFRRRLDGDPLANIAILRDPKRILAVMKDGVFAKSPDMEAEREMRWAA